MQDEINNKRSDLLQLNSEIKTIIKAKDELN